MNDLSHTALVTLKCHVQDAKNKDSILNDSNSLKMYEYLSGILDEKSKNILGINYRNSLVKHTACRAKKYDDYAIQFLQTNPEAVIVNIGCGLDHRFERIDNGKCLFFDLDLSEIMGIKKSVFPASKRYRQISQSVFKVEWLREIKREPVLFIAEGVFMYCNEHDIRALFDELHKRVPGSGIIFEVFSSKWLSGWKGKLVEIKLRKQLQFGKDASFKFGISDSDEIERWSDNFKLIEDWSYFDIILPGAKDSLRKIQWTVYYHIT